MTSRPLRTAALASSRRAATIPGLTGTSFRVLRPGQGTIAAMTVSHGARPEAR